MASSVLALGLVATTAIPSRAAELWTGTTSSDWFDAGNWSAGVPTNATSTRIDTVTPNATVIGAAGAKATGLRVGVFGTGALTIQNGGTMNNTLGIIGDQAGSTGTVLVTGAGSTWANNGNDLYVGADGNGTLNIKNGGAVSNRYGMSPVISAQPVPRPWMAPARLGPIARISASAVPATAIRTPSGAR